MPPTAHNFVLYLVYDVKAVSKKSPCAVKERRKTCEHNNIQDNEVSDILTTVLVPVATGCFLLMGVFVPTPICELACKCITLA